MTILMTADAVGGVWTYALDLIRALPHHTWVLATMGPEPREDQLREIDELQCAHDVRLHVGPFSLEWQENPWREVDEAGQWLLELEREFRPDIVHLNGYVHGACDFLAPKLVVAHSCVLSWWRAVKDEDAPPEWNRYFERVRQGLGAADAVAAPTRAMLRDVQAIYGPLPQPPERVQVLANGRDALFCEQKVEREAFVFAAGRLWDEAKNLSLLERAAPTLRWPVRVAGDGQTDIVECLGRLETREVWEQMRRAGIYALPAKYEPFGLSILEAALCGCALVVGDLPSLREVWGDAALFVPPNDAGALEQAINRLADDDALRQEMALRAGGRARRYSLQNFARGYEEFYQLMLANYVKEPAILS
jgi:glycogen(starch) synthase